jgi:hypothetical protein
MKLNVLSTVALIIAGFAFGSVLKNHMSRNKHVDAGTPDAGFVDAGR